MKKFMIILPVLAAIAGCKTEKYADVGNKRHFSG